MSIDCKWISSLQINGEGGLLACLDLWSFYGSGVTTVPIYVDNLL